MWNPARRPILICWRGGILMGIVVLLGVSFYSSRKEMLQKKEVKRDTEVEVLNVPKMESQCEQENNIPNCPFRPPNLKGRIPVLSNVSLTDAESLLSVSVQHGGKWWPSECKARWTVAILVPFRNRHNQVGPFLYHMHPFLQKQQLNYSIFIVEQTDSLLFNRAKLLNVGFVESQKKGPFDCYVFHDVDLLPEDDRHLYHCSLMPRHLNVAASNNKYKSSMSMQYSRYFGGVSMMLTAHVKGVNGWSNKYWGWGGEDDDMWRRNFLMDLSIWRYPPHIARYTMLPHDSPVVNPNRYKDLRKNIVTFRKDGLNSLHYELQSFEQKPLFTHIRANLNEDITASENS